MSGQDYEQLTLFQGDSPASRLVLPGSAEARRMTVTSGLKCLELSRNSGPLGSLVRTLLGSSIWRSTRCTLTWKTKATPSRRLLFRLVPSTPRTGGTGALLSGVERWKKNITGKDGDPILWKTPIASDSANMEFYHNSRGEPNLSGMVKMWHTPKATDYKGSGPAGSKSAEHDLKKHNLKGVVMFYPTPTTGAGLCGGTGNFQRLKKLETSGQITEEERRNMSQGNGGQLNPTWVEWLMGFPLGWTDLNASETR